MDKILNVGRCWYMPNTQPKTPESLVKPQVFFSQGWSLTFSPPESFRTFGRVDYFSYLL